MTGNGAAKRITAMLLAFCLLPALRVAVAAEEPVGDLPAQVEGQSDTGPENGDALPGLPDSSEPSGEPAWDGGAMPAAATPTTLGYSGAQAGDGAALLELLESDPGGVITLDGDITLSGDLDIIYLNSPLTVDAGPHTITVDTYLYIFGPITFTGSGTVIRVTANGLLSFGDAGQARVVASGSGSTALYMEYRDRGELENDPIVRANGDGATAIYAEGNWDFICVDVAAAGNGSTGIHTTGSAYLALSQIRGDGEAVVSDTGKILLESSDAVPEPEEAEVRRLHGTYDVHESRWVTTPGSPLELEDEYPFYFQAANGRGFGISLPVSWDESGVDYNTPGSYPLTGTVQESAATRRFTWNPLEFTVRVVRSDRAVITDATLYGDKELLLHLLEEVYGAWWIEVWCSEDGGDTWRDLDEEGMTTVDGKMIRIAGLPDSVTYHFYLEVWGGPLQGTSNTLEFYADPDKRQGGGEREGNNDGEDDDLPPITDPPPVDPDTGGGDGGSGGTTTRSGGASRSGGSGRDTADGADTEEPVKAEEQQTPPTPPAVPLERDIGQPAAAAYAANRAEPAETETPAYPDGVSVWSADRLALMAADYPRQITFHSGDLSADLPTAALLEAVDGGDFAILLEQPSDSALRVRFYTGGSELEELGGEPFRITFPVTGEQRALRCVGENGEPVEVVRTGAKASVTLTRTGDYTLEPQIEEAAILPLTAEGTVRPAESEIAPEAATGLPVIWMILPAATLLAAAAGFLLCRKRRAGRG